MYVPNKCWCNGEMIKTATVRTRWWSLTHGFIQHICGGAWAADCSSFQVVHPLKAGLRRTIKPNCLRLLYCVPTLCQLLRPSFKRECVIGGVFPSHFSASVMFQTTPPRLSNLDVFPRSCDGSSWDIFESPFPALIPFTHAFHIPADGPDSRFTSSTACDAVYLWFLFYFWGHLIRIQKGWKGAEYRSCDKAEIIKTFSPACVLHIFLLPTSK